MSGLPLRWEMAFLKTAWQCPYLCPRSVTGQPLLKTACYWGRWKGLSTSPAAGVRIRWAPSTPREELPAGRSQGKRPSALTAAESGWSVGLRGPAGLVPCTSLFYACSGMFQPSSLAELQVLGQPGGWGSVGAWSPAVSFPAPAAGTHPLPSFLQGLLFLLLNSLFFS